MGKVVKVSAGRPAQVTIRTIAGDVKSKDVHQTIERHRDIGIGDFNFNKKEASIGRWGKYKRLNLLRLLVP